MTRVETIGEFSIAFVGDIKMVTIYAILPRDEASVVYVGSSSRILRDRIRGHVADVQEGSILPIHVWMRAQPGFVVRVLETVTVEHREARERHWVSVYKDTLLNLTNGGVGLSGHRFAGTEHARRIQAAVRSGSHFDCQRCGAKFWRKRIEISKGHNKFCSRVCSNARHKEVSHVS